MSLSPTRTLLSPAEVARDLQVRDLTDPRQGPHAIQLVVDDVVGALASTWRGEVSWHRARPVSSIEDNYERLRFSADSVTRDARYSRYVSETTILRTHTSALVPPALRALARGAYRRDVLLACPGITYRRDAIDRLHTGTPHQLDLWRVVDGGMTARDLEEMIAVVVEAAMPGAELRTIQVEHPYTVGGRQVDVRANDGAWVEIGECGVTHPEVLRDAGLDPNRWGGLAMGIGLDRIVMVRKGVADIRLLRSTDQRVASQMLDLAPYRPVSDLPSVTRDLSVAVPGDADSETMGDRVRDALGDDSDAVEEVAVLTETQADDLPDAAVARLGLQPGQKNVLVRVVLRPADRTLTDAAANVLRDRIYAALHQGTAQQWAGT